jgi:GAF domain-containing protein
LKRSEIDRGEKRMEYMQYDESEKDMVLVPSVVLHTILQGAKKEVEEKKQLLAELEKATSELNRLEIHAIKLQEEIDKKKANSHINMRLTSISRARSRIVEKKDLEGGDQTDELDQLFVREENLMALIEATRNISEQSAYLDVVSSAMHAAQNIIAAERYTLAILNDKKTVLEVFANASPQKSEQANFIQEAFIPVDSTTTYGRVILTGKALEVNALMESEFLEGQVENLDFEPQGLLCTPIFNVHGNLVGVFQIITKKTALDSSQPQISHLSGSNSSANPIERSGSRKNYSPFSSLEKESFNYICAVIGTAIWNLTLSKARQAAQSQIDSLLKLNRNISAETNGAAVIEQIVIVSYELLNAERISIYIRSEGTDEFYLANASDVKEEQYQTNHNGIVGFVVRTGEAVLTNDAYAHPEFDPEFDETTGYLSKQILCTPVRNAEGNVLAVICAVNKVDGSEFTHEDLLYLNYAADAAGVSLHKSNLLREVIFSQKITEARLKFTNFVSASTSISDFVNLVMEEGKKIMECDRFGLLLVDHLKKELWITPQVGGQNIRMPINKGISGLVATTGQVVCTRDACKYKWEDLCMSISSNS